MKKPRRNTSGEAAPAPTQPPRAALYDPNCEKDEREQKCALHWELLRRNATFRQAAERWLAGAEFRFQHAATDDYHHKNVHVPRCALDWMLAPDERVEVARHQIALARWFTDTRFNFGPVEVALKVHPLGIRLDSVAAGFDVRPLKNPSPLRLDQCWPDTPAAFRAQFALAIHGEAGFQDLTQPLCEVGDYLRWAAARLHRNDTPEKLPEIIRDLHIAGQRIRDLAEFHLLFAIPKVRCPSRRLEEHLDAIRQQYKTLGLIENRYVPHASYLGTPEPWKWFLIAEQRGFDCADSTAMYALARDYSDDLRQRMYADTARGDADRHGFRGTAVPSGVLRNRRKTVATFIRLIEQWRDAIYPPARWLQFLQESSR